MTHDPMCPYKEGPKWDDFCPMCGLIAKVRKDTLAKVQEFLSETRYSYRTNFRLHDEYRDGAVDALLVVSDALDYHERFNALQGKP
jgi:hypothetical protein